MSTYRDSSAHPAILLAFGYSALNDKTTKVLAVRDGRVVVRMLTPDEFDAEYVACELPQELAVRRLASLSRSGGADLDARREILWALGDPGWRWRIWLIERLARIRDCTAKWQRASR